MALLRKKTKAKKAQLEASAAAAEARRAAQDSAAAVRDLAQALMAQVKELGIDERAAETVDRIRSSDTYGRAQAKANDLGKRVGESERVAVSRENAAKTTAAAMSGLGTWLASGKRGQALGISGSKRRGGGWFLALLGIGVGYAIGIFTAPKQGREMREQIGGRGGSSWDGPVGNFSGDHGVAAPSGDPQLADKVRTRLGEDPRTTDLPSLNINVVDGTVVVRGSLPDDADEGAVRDVVADVDGVRDVEMELGRA
ncbi:hypothetical protein BH23ACT10_BH23ACT10_13850 [soil metagenome]